MLLVVGVHAAWFGLTWWQQELPWWVLTPSLAWVIAWHGSLQHEMVHGHPTRWGWFNRGLASLPVALWLPYDSYRSTHLVHHADEHLTDPLDDPESRYLAVSDWVNCGRCTHLLLRAQKTFAGRLLIGPAWTVPLFLRAQVRLMRAGDAMVLRAWAWHLAFVALVLVWLVAVCHMSLLYYVLGVLYPAVSLSLIRSFAEHKAADGVAERTAVVENAWVLGPLFLFNNLHAAHHARPSLAWYKLPGWYRQNRQSLLCGNGQLVYDGYLDVARRYLFTAHDAVAHPIIRVLPVDPAMSR